MDPRLYVALVSVPMAGLLIAIQPWTLGWIRIDFYPEWIMGISTVWIFIAVLWGKKRGWIQTDALARHSRFAIMIVLFTQFLPIALGVSQGHTPERKKKCKITFCDTVRSHSALLQPLTHRHKSLIKTRYII